MSNAFECILSCQPEYFSGSPVMVGFELRNMSQSSLFMLKWYTPLEGLAGKVFRVEREGVAVEYRGVLAKRGEPTADDYLEVPGRGSVSVAVDLTQAYDFTLPGNYEVAFISHLHDVVARREELPRPQDRHRSVSLQCGTARFRLLAGTTK